MATHKSRLVEVFEYKGEGNSLKIWYKVRNPLRVLLNVIVLNICKFLPSLTLKNFLYRALGMKIGKNVSIAYGVMFDLFFPELIEIGDNSIIGYNSTILTHEFLIDEWRKGQVKIGKNVLIGSWVLVLPGVVIQDRAKIASYSLVNKSVWENTFAGGVPVRKIK